MKICWDGLSHKQDYALKWKISCRNRESLGKKYYCGKIKLLDVLFHVVELHGQEMLINTERKCSCLLNACCIPFLFIAKIGKHTSTKIPANTPCAKWMGGIRKHSREMGRPVLLYELFICWLLLPRFPRSRWCEPCPGCLASSLVLLPLGQRFGLNNPIKLCSLCNSVGLRQQSDWLGYRTHLEMVY